MIKYCEICNKEINVRPSKVLIGKGRFCSKKCFDNHQIGKLKKRKGTINFCKTCNKEFYVRVSYSNKKFCSRKCIKGYIPTEETKNKIRDTQIKKGVMPPSQKGKKLTLSHRMKIGRRGELSVNWKGGITKDNDRIRNSIEYKEWRKMIFERDEYACVICGSNNCNGNRTPLQADHIKPFALYPELRFDIDNGRTLCIPCHKKTDTYLNRWNNKNDTFATSVELGMCAMAEINFMEYDKIVNEL